MLIDKTVHLIQMDRQTWSSKIATTHTKLIIIHTNDTPNTRTTLRHSYPNHHHTNHTVDTSTSHATHTSSAPTLYHSSSHVPHYQRSSCCLIFSLQPVSVCFRSLLSPPAIYQLHHVMATFSSLSSTNYDHIFIIIRKTSYYDHIFIFTRLVFSFSDIWFIVEARLRHRNASPSTFFLK